MKEAVTIGESRCWERLRAGKEITSYEIKMLCKDRHAAEDSVCLKGRDSQKKTGN